MRSFSLTLIMVVSVAYGEKLSCRSNLAQRTPLLLYERREERIRTLSEVSGVREKTKKLKPVEDPV
jgi:hypothetical protein